MGSLTMRASARNSSSGSRISRRWRRACPLERSQDVFSRDSPLGALGKAPVGMHQPLDQHPHARLVEGSLAGIGGGADRFRLDLNGGDVGARSDGSSAPMNAVGEIQDLAEATARLHAPT